MSPFWLLLSSLAIVIAQDATNSTATNSTTSTTNSTDTTTASTNSTGTASTTDVDQCSCGYYDSTTLRLFTESIVVYFNETDSLPTDIFEPQSFTHKKEKGWTAIYRQGAVPENVAVGNDSQVSWLEDAVNPYSLELFCDGYTADHLVDGGAISTLRQDILYGSFRASMRSPHPWAGGSALSMMLPFNDSDTLELDMLNTDDSDTARVTTLFNNEYQYAASPYLGINYTVIQNGTNGTAAQSPWDYMDVQIDWTQDQVNFTVAGYLVRSVMSDTTSVSIPTVPVPLVFKHWSTGDTNFMQGPPTSRSGANVAYIRSFFNSSAWSVEQHADFDARCTPSLACSMDDLTLRGFTSFNSTQEIAYNYYPKDRDLVFHSAMVAAVFGAFGIFILFNAVLRRRIPWHKIGGLLRNRKNARRQNPFESESTLVSTNPSQNSLSGREKKFDSRSNSPSTTACNTRNGSPVRSAAAGEWPDKISELPFSSASRTRFTQSPNPSEEGFGSAPTVRSRASTLTMVAESSIEMENLKAIDHGRTKSVTGDKAPRIAIQELRSTSRLNMELAKARDPSKANKQDILEHHDVPTTSDFHTKNTTLDYQGATRNTVDAVAMPPSAPPAAPALVVAQPNVRIDYLAGVVAFACVCVTFVHFVLTFIPGVSGWGAVDHDASDYWAKKTIGPYLLSEAWIGPFFTTSARFLSARYLRSGKLADVGNKMLLRAPRMVVPVAMIALLQYFFIELGLTGALEYLPSISWSTWPYVTGYPNFGGYINSMLDLSYIMPSAAPQIIPHYCVGVLWTIPVQLQFSYLVLIAAVMIREIKTPWKRFSFYFFCIANNYYAFSWGACFWMGLMLSDLSVTYKYAKWIQSRWWAQYGICTSMWLLAAACSTVFLAANDLNFDFLTKERGIHVDPSSGLPIAQTSSAGYPNYYEPRLNTILMAGALQVIVELSTSVQWFLSRKVWIWIFPHIMTIYLIHGFIFWTIGAVMVVGMSEAGVPYWATMLVTVVVCYGTLAVACHIITPLTDSTAKAACKNIWRWAEAEPVPKKATLGAFSKNLILQRHAASEEKMHADA